MVPREDRLPRKLSEQAGIRTSTLLMVGERGFEPPRYYYHMALNHARLPVPPLAPKMVRGFTTATIFESEPRPRRGAG